MTTATNTRHTLEIKFSKAPNLIRALSNALLFAGSDFTLPMLCVAKFEFDGQDLTIAATDRYRLSVEKVEYRDLAPTDAPHEALPAFEFLLPTPAVKAVIQQLKASKFDPVTLTYDQDGHSLRVATLAGSAEHQLYEGSFPAYRSLIPSLDTRSKVDQIGFNAKWLADLAKVQTGRGRISEIRMGLYGEKKPTRVDFNDGPTVILMPVKINPEDRGDGASNWGAV
jgi:DNA polymerase-3 subunit beta